MLVFRIFYLYFYFSKQTPKANQIIKQMHFSLGNLHSVKRLKLQIMTLVICLSANCVFSQAPASSKNQSAPNKKAATKVAPKPFDPQSKNLPEYYAEYAHGGDFRNGKVLAQDEQEAFSFILAIPILLFNNGDDVKSMQLWKEAVRSCFPDKNSSAVNANDVTENGSSPQFVDVGSPNTSTKNINRPRFSLPVWVGPYLSNDLDFNKLYQYQYKVGNVLYCDGLNSIPYLVNADSKTQEEKLKEADKYYNTLYAWSAAYPELFYALDDPNFLFALKQKNKEVVYHYGFYRFLLTDSLKEVFKSKDKMVKKS